MAATQAVLFANPSSGRAKRWLFQLIEGCPAHGLDLVSTHFDLRPEAIQEALDVAQGRGVNVVLAAGGDGTMGTVAGCLAHTDFTMGVLPTGTSNDFARSLAIPIHPDSALAIVAEGKAIRVDLGEAGDRIFCHAATVGINTEFARAAGELRGAVGRVSYPLAALRVYRRRKRFGVRIETADDVRSLDAFEVAFVNAPVYGGPLELEVARSELEDRMLRAVVVQDIAPAALLSGLLMALRRRPIRVRGVRSFSVTEATVRTVPPLPVTVDGEIGEQTPQPFRVLPASLRVFVPSSFARSKHGTAV